MLLAISLFATVHALVSLPCKVSECSTTYVHFTQKDNGTCDIECMNGMCNYDRNYAGVTECEMSCAYTGCVPSLMKFGVCDVICNTPECGYDFGDCAYCSLGCVQSSLGNGVCDTLCDNDECQLDAGDCGFCAHGCFEPMLGDGHCDAECLNLVCENDRGDCDFQNCAPGCFPYEVGNWVCDPQCNVSECAFDGGDCYCSPGCSPDLLLNSVCDLACATVSCGLDGHLCVSFTQGDCANNCFWSMVGNGVCDLDCFTPECNYDQVDCGCSPGCSVDMYGRCEYPCLVPSCDYDGCWGTSRHVTSFAWQATSKLLDTAFDFDRDCHAYAPDCLHGNLQWMISAKVCYTLCEPCAHAYGTCNSKGLAAGCVWGFNQNFGGCILCTRKQIYTSCVDRCTRAFPDHPVSKNICYPAPDISTPTSPDAIYVAASGTGTNTGTIGDPYHSLSAALAQNFMAYSTVYLLSGQHPFSRVRKPVAEVILLDNDARPMNNGFGNKRLRVTTLFCTGSGDHPHCATTRATVLVRSLDLVLDINCEVTFENLIIDGTQSLGSGNVDPDGFYCPRVTTSNGKMLNDRGEEVDYTDYIPQTVCDQYKDSVLFAITSSGSLSLRGVDIINLRHQPRALIDNDGGTVTLAQVNFRNVIVSFENGAVVRHRSRGSFSYTQGSVTYVNNGYEFVEGLSVGGFLEVDADEAGAVGDISISSVTFSKNIALAESARGLFTLRRFRTFTLEDCTFLANIATYLLHIDGAGLALSQWVDASGSVADFSLEHIHFKSCSFSNNFADHSLISASFSSDLQNIAIEDCTFRDNVARHSPVIDLVYTGKLTLEITEGQTKAISGGVGYFAPRHVRIVDSAFSRNLGVSVFSVRNMANVAFSSCSLSDSGASEALTYNDLIVDLFISDPRAYVLSRHRSEVPAMARCEGLLLLSACAGVEVADSQFAENYCDAGVAGIVLTQGGARLRALKFTGNRAVASNGSVLSCTATATAITITGVEFESTRNEAAQGTGVVYFGPGTTVAILQSRFSNNQVPSASGIWADDPVKISISDTLFLGNTATKGNGSALSVRVDDGVSESSLVVTACTFSSNQSARAKGGVFLFSDKPTRPFSLQIAGSEFSGNAASTFGAAIFIDTNLALVNSALTNCRFVGNVSAGGTLVLLFATGQLTLTASVFLENRATSGAAISLSTQTSALLYVADTRFEGNRSSGGVVELTDIGHSKRLETKNCSFLRNSGVAVALERGSWTDSQSSYSSTSGSAVSLTSGSSASLTGAQFTSNASPNNGGAVYASSESTLQCTRCSFTRNAAAGKGGAVFLEQSSVLTLSACIFESNKSGDSGSALFLLGSPSAVSTISSSTFRGNAAGNSGTVSLLLSALQVHSTAFDSNSATGASPGIVLNLSTLTVRQSTFQSQKAVIGAFLYATADSVAVVSDSAFTSATAESGGAFAIIASKLNLSSSSLSNLSATSAAGLIAFSESTLVLTNVRMTDLTAADSAIAVINLGSISVVGSYFDKFAHSGINAEKLSQMTIRNSVFSNGHGELGGALTCTRCQSVEVDSSTFANNTATYGGGIYLSAQLDSLVPAVYQISSTTFRNNTSWRGGGVYTNNVNIAFERCVFQQNQAVAPQQAELRATGDWGRGGGAMTDCGQAPTCALSFARCRFEGNSADVSGGGVAWQDVRPTVTNCSFNGNKADYASDLSSFAIEMQVAGRRLSVSDVASGQVASQQLTISLLDHYGQVVTTDNSSVAEMLAVDPSTTTVSGETKVTAVRGTYTFGQYIVTAEPKTTVAVKVLTNAIDPSKALKALDSSEYQNSIVLQMEMRACVLGESHVLRTCQVCERGKYSLDPESLACSNCPAEAICYGNYSVVPRAGYWRTRYDSEVFYACFYPPACIGSPADPLSLTGNCATGYEGRLCQSCSSGYSHTNKNECGLCPDPAANIVRMVFTGVALVLVAAVLVNTTMRSAYRQKSQSSIYLKILMNYLQIMVLVGSFNLDWSQEVTEFLSVQESSGQLTEQIVSLDCFLKGGAASSATAVYGKLVMMALLPCAVGACSLLVWLLVQWSRSLPSFPSNSLFATVVILLFLIHPSVTKYLFNVFACMEVDGRYYLLQALEVQCWDGQHSFYLLACALPGIVLWVVGVPALCLLYLARNRRRLGAISARMRLGFLFNGFRASAYYWEFVILYRKILLISCSVFLTTISTRIQALCVIVVLLASLYAQDQVRPYTTHSLNDVELQSILSASVTIYCGLFFLTGEVSVQASLLLLAAILAANAVFFWHWGRRIFASYVMVVVNAIPYLRRRVGMHQGVKDGLDADLFVQPHYADALHVHCKGFSPMLQEAAHSLRTMKDLYIMKLRHDNRPLSISSILRSGDSTVFLHTPEEILELSLD